MTRITDLDPEGILPLHPFESVPQSNDPALDVIRGEVRVLQGVSAERRDGCFEAFVLDAIWRCDLQPSSSFRGLPPVNILARQGR